MWSSWCHCHPIISCFDKIQIGLFFLELAYPGCRGKKGLSIAECIDAYCIQMYIVLELLFLWLGGWSGQQYHATPWGWPKTWNTQGILWTWKTHRILREFCATLQKLFVVIFPRLHRFPWEFCMSFSGSENSLSIPGFSRFVAEWSKQLLTGKQDRYDLRE